MKKTLLTILFITSLASIANAKDLDFDLEGFRERLTKDLEIGRVLFSCGEEAEGIVKIYEEGNRIAELHGVEGILPDANDLCANAVSDAIKNGISLKEISEATRSN